MRSVDFTNIYKKYKGEWIALDSDLKKVISSGKTLKETNKAVIKKGYSAPVFFRVPQKNLPFYGQHT